MRPAVQRVVGAGTSGLCRAVVGEDVSQPAGPSGLFSEADAAERLHLSLAWYTFANETQQIEFIGCSSTIFLHDFSGPT